MTMLHIFVSGGTGIYLRIVFIIGLLAVLAHAIFHIVLKAIATDSKPYGSMFPNCKYKIYTSYTCMWYHRSR